MASPEWIDLVAEAEEKKRELLRGAAEARPNLNRHNACRLCPYGAVCGSEFSENDVQEDDASQEEALARMREALQEGGEQDG